MKPMKRGISVLISLLLIMQVSLPAVVLAADETAAQPTVSANQAPSDSTTPTPTPVPTESPAATPSPTATLEPSPSPGVLAATEPASPSPTPSPNPEATPNPASTRGAEPVCHGSAPDFVYDNTASKWIPADMDSFTCDTASGYFLSPKYYVDTRTGWYRTMPATGIAPVGSLTGVQILHTVLGDVAVGSPEYKAAVAMGIITPTGQFASTNGTGSDSNNQTGIAGSNQSWFDFTSLVNVINVLGSQATSGDAAAQDNTKVGSVSSGTVNVVANLINLLASAWSWSHGNLNFFMSNIFGNQTGDIRLQPTSSSTGGGGLGQSASTAGTGSGSTNGASLSQSDQLNVNAKSSGSITNEVDLSAASGNAVARDNTLAGDVTSGNATAQANIINLISSFISSGDSFFGIMNIFGNLNGDILFPDGFLNGLLSGSPAPGGTATQIGTTGAGSTNQVGMSNNASTTATGSSTQAFDNRIDTNARSGNVNSAGNTVAGNATSGAATTAGSLFNLSNTSIFGDNAVLVMVNVLGHWMGRIMTIPGSTTQSALLTGNAQVVQNDTGSNSTNTTSVSTDRSARINQSAVGSITNDVNVNAATGDAVAQDNTKVGSIASGTAKATSSVANIMNSALNIKHWFGVLVINVFGGWIGSVNENTSAGSMAPVSGHAAEVAPEKSGAPETSTRRRSPSGTTAQSEGTSSSQQNDVVSLPDQKGQSLVLAATTSRALPATATLNTQGKSTDILLLASALLVIIGSGLYSLERRIRRR